MAMKRCELFMMALRMQALKKQGLFGIDISSNTPTVHMTREAFKETFPEVEPEVVDDFAAGKATQYRVERDGVIYFYIVLKEVV